GAKASIRDVGRALGMTYADVDRVARLVPNMPPSFGVMTIVKALEEGPEIRQLYEADPQIAKLIDTARAVEGVARHASTHAAGVVIAPAPLANFLPLQRPSSGDPNALPTTQYAMNEVAELGLLKMDFLGLTNLTILGKAVEVIEEARGIRVDISALPDGDAKTYEMLAQGETFGVFQLESAGMRRYVQELKPTCIKDLAAMVALYRPGPMQHIPTYIRAKHGLAEVSYPHPDLSGVLDETHGVIVYQDQVLLIAQQFAGYSLGQADVMRKAMGKKIRAIMRAEEQRFLKGAQKKGYTKAQAQEIFNLIEPFAGYAFNKAHAVSYATIAYQTAYLMANYPAEYMTAVLMMAEHHPAGAAQRVAEAYGECGRLGIQLLPPDVARSEVNFGLGREAEGSVAIRFGLANVKNVGVAMAEGVTLARQSGGPFDGIEDFFERVGVRHLNRRALESLVKAGAFDRFGERGSLLASLDRLIAYGQRVQKQRESGQTSLFDLPAAQGQASLSGLQLEAVPEMPQQEKLTWEKELLGIYLSEHPFAQASREMKPHLSCGLVDVSAEMAGRDLVLGGIVTGTRSLTTRDSRLFLAAEIEDLTGSLEVTVWPETYEQTRELWQTGNLVVISVRVRSRDDRLQISVQKAVLYGEGQFDPAALVGSNGGRGPRRHNGGRGGGGNGRSVPPPATPSGGPLRILLEETEDVEGDQERLRALMNALREYSGEDYSGEDEVRLAIRQRDGEEVELELPRARQCPELSQRLGEIVGPWGQIS
ncbi:MAG: DNA polymerase III subunit alpha, partial [Dehalococcoidia bacterium]